MKKCIETILLSVTVAMVSAQEPVVIEKQGHFSVAGKTIQREGEYDNSKFVGWATQEEKGQSYRADHAFVHYQIPVQPKKLPLVFIHGYGGSGVCWEMTPDGRDGFSTLMLRKHYSTYVMDLPGRGHAGRTSATTTVKPVADEMFWFDIWRIGVWPDYNKGVQFPTDSVSLSQFFREMTPDLSDHRQDVTAIDALTERIGKNILVTHSAGGFPGWMAAMQNQKVKGVVAYEPGGYVFPEGEVPAPIEGLTGGVQGIPVPLEQFMKLTQIPIVMYFGDYIPETPSEKLGDENWRVRLQMGRKFVEAINRHGGNATFVELPKIGIYGNTHFLMQDLNNTQLADLLEQWLDVLVGQTQTMTKAFSSTEQELIDISNAKWQWMSEKNVDKLESLFHENAMFVHMGGSWGKEAELETIKGGFIHYKHTDIHDVSVKFTANTGIVYSNIHLTSMVAGNEVTFPFMVTEVFVKENGNWQLGSLVFTRLLERTENQ